MNRSVDRFFQKAEKWRDEFARLREIVLGSGLSEELKWGQPCYLHQGRNVVLIHGFKDYCALLFMKGALMKDQAGALVQQTENVQSARQLRFAGLPEIVNAEALIASYVAEAVEVEKSGRKVQRKETAQFDVPEELLQRLDEDPAFKTAFEALTPGRQRGYLLHFASAKQARTRSARIEKAADRILAGKGLDD
ncbi:MAG TPA: YdeI/OmpD-associated family protein [Bordetella sp.]|uniref:YdeI/OmpD-associated family protein n=1 Tax=Bordetella sp. TaxID=28081 RepID=UPI002ED0BFB0